MIAFKILLVLFFGFVLEINGQKVSSCQCGVENLRTRIIDGHAAQKGKYPWMTSVMIQSGFSMSSCGGSLINDRYILTAAHCLKSTKDVKNLRVTLGVHTSTERQTKAPLAVEKIIVHPNYKGYNDIALIKLKDPITNVSPVCLPSFKDYDNLFVTGWGLTGKSGNNLLSRASELMEVDVKEIDILKCKQKHFPQVDIDKEICAGGENGGSCMGDSGGPLQTRKNGRVYQVGIVSFGSTDCSTITKAPNVYERITGQLDWIADNTKDANYCDAPQQAIAITDQGPGKGRQMTVRTPGSGHQPVKPIGGTTPSPPTAQIPKPIFVPVKPDPQTTTPRPSPSPNRPTFVTIPGSGVRPIPPTPSLPSGTSGRWIIIRPIGGQSSSPSSSASDLLRDLENLMGQSAPSFPSSSAGGRGMIIQFGRRPSSENSEMFPGLLELERQMVRRI